MARSEKKLTDVVEAGKRVGTRLVTILALGGVRVLLVFLTLLLLGWLLFDRVWNPLQVEVALPPGVDRTIPTIDVATWERIQEAQRERINFERADWNRYLELFVVREPRT